MHLIKSKRLPPAPRPPVMSPLVLPLLLHPGPAVLMLTPVANTPDRCPFGGFAGDLCAEGSLP